MAKQILVIDDDHVIRELLKTLFEDFYDVLFSRSAREGLDMLSENAGLVFLDYKLPDAGGLEVLKKIKALYTSIPVIFMTGYGNEDVCRKAFSAGARDYIKKPFDVDEVRSKTDALMNVYGGNERRANALSDLTIKYIAPPPHGNIPAHILCNILKVKKYIDEHYGEHIRLSDAAKMACMSKTAFCSYFKNVVGCTFGYYSEKVRFEKARELLKDKTLSITDISMELGYRNLNYFIDAFRKMSGISPGEFRRNAFDTR